MKINEIRKISGSSFTGLDALDVYNMNYFYGKDDIFKPFRDDFYRAYTRDKFLIAVKNSNPKLSPYKMLVGEVKIQPREWRTKYAGD